MVTATEDAAKSIPFPESYFRRLVENASLLLAMAKNPNVLSWVESSSHPDACNDEGESICE
jgi:hypothetical protein